MVKQTVKNKILNPRVSNPILPFFQNGAGIDSSPLNIMPEDPKIRHKYAAVEVPAGVRGCMSLLDPLLEDAEAAILVKDAPIRFGCMGCQRTNELVGFLIRAKRNPSSLDDLLKPSYICYTAWLQYFISLN